MLCICKKSGARLGTRPGFGTRPIHFGFVVDEVALGQVFSPSTSVFPCRPHSTNAPYSFIRHRPCINVATDSVISDVTRRALCSPAALMAAFAVFCAGPINSGKKCPVPDSTSNVLSRPVRCHSAVTFCRRRLLDEVPKDYSRFTGHDVSKCWCIAEASDLESGV
jgi:hypothetical protein